MDKLVYRRAIPEDVDRFQSLIRTIINKPDLTILHEFFIAGYKHDSIEKLSPRAILIVSEHLKDKTIKGFTLIEPFACHYHSFDHVATMGIYVEPDSWGKGIGRRLLEIGCEEAAKAMYEKFFTIVRRDNIRALRLFVKNGFRIVGVAHNYAKKDKKYIDVVVIEKLL